MAASDLPQFAASARPPVPVDVRNECALQYLDEVKFIAWRIGKRLPKHVPFDDLVQAGMVGLIEASERFDHDRAVGFLQYARIRIAGAILDSLRELDPMSRYMRSRQRKMTEIQRGLEFRLGREATSEEIAEELGMDLQSFFEFTQSVDVFQPTEPAADGDAETSRSVLDSLPSDPRHSPEEEFAQEELKARIRKCMASLNDSQRRVLQMYYFEELSMAAIASAMGLTESRISQIHARALCAMESSFESWDQKLASRRIQ